MKQMQQMERVVRLDGAESRHVEAAVETLAAIGCRGESLAEVAHDARNMVTALGLYCDLLEEPGVLVDSFHHYGSELRLVATASRRLVEKLAALDSGKTGEASLTREGDTFLAGEELKAESVERSLYREMLPATPINNLAEELLASRNLLAALAGAAIAVTVDAEGGARPVLLTGEDLIRVLVNLVKNAAEAMPQGGGIHLGLRERRAEVGAKATLVLTLEDNGPGIAAKALKKIFDSGYTTRTGNTKGSGSGRGPGGAHRGLGLSITRSILEAAGGRIHASNCASSGARFEIELPVREM